MGRLFSFVVTVVVVGTCLFVATRIAIGQVPEAVKPATRVPRRVRGEVHDPGGDVRRRVSSADVDPSGSPARAGHHASGWRRVRSMVLLVALLTVLGLILALVIGIVGAVVLNGLRSAVQ